MKELAVCNGLKVGPDRKVETQYSIRFALNAVSPSSASWRGENPDLLKYERAIC
jgi:hypothetical protein